MCLLKTVFRGIIFFCLTVNLCTTFTNIVLFKNYSKIDSQPQKCIMKIVTKYFPCNSLINLVNYNSDIRYLTRNINNGTLCYNVIIRLLVGRTAEFLHWTNQYILLSRDLSDLQKVMASITQDKYWNSRANFIVYVEKVTNNEIQYVFETLFDYKTYNVVVLVHEEVTSIYTHLPFHDGNCGKTIGDVRLLGSCEYFNDAHDCFPNKFINGLKNCTVTVVLLEHVPNVIFRSSNYTRDGSYVPGTEQYFLNNIAAIEGLNLRYIDSKENFGGVVLPNGTATGLLHFLKSGKADIAAGAIRLIKNRADVFDYVWSANYITYCMFTSVQPTPNWEKFYKEFDSKTWMLILVCYALITILCVLSFKLSPRKLKNNVGVFFQLYGFFFMGNSSRSLLAKKKIRIILACWIWLTFFVSNFYVTDLYSLMSTHKKQTKGVNKDKLIDLPFKPCLSDTIRNFFQYSYNITLPENKFNDCIVPGKAIDIVASHAGLYTINTKVSYIIKEYKYFDDKGNRKLDIYDFSGDFMIVSYLNPGFPLRDKLQKHAQHFFESGLIKRHLETLSIHSQSMLESNSETYKIFQFNDLRVHFLVLSFGSTLATLAFIVELISRNKRKP